MRIEKWMADFVRINKRQVASVIIKIVNGVKTYHETILFPNERKGREHVALLNAKIGGRAGISAMKPRNMIVDEYGNLAPIPPKKKKDEDDEDEFSGWWSEEDSKSIIQAKEKRPIPQEPNNDGVVVGRIRQKIEQGKEDK